MHLSHGGNMLVEVGNGFVYRFVGFHKPKKFKHLKHFKNIGFHIYQFQITVVFANVFEMVQENTPALTANVFDIRQVDNYFELSRLYDGIECALESIRSHGIDVTTNLDNGGVALNAKFLGIQLETIHADLLEQVFVNV